MISATDADERLLALQIQYGWIDGGQGAIGKKDAWKRMVSQNGQAEGWYRQFVDQRVVPEVASKIALAPAAFKADFGLQSDTKTIMGSAELQARVAMAGETRSEEYDRLAKEWALQASLEERIDEDAA